MVLVGCTNEVEEEKNVYLTYKSNLQETEDLKSESELGFNTYFDVQKEGEEKINYSLVISDAKVDMYDVKALLIHDFMVDDVFPSVGIFDEPVQLLRNSDDEIVLSGSINSDSDISDIKFRLYLEYEDSNNLTNAIYYEVHRG